MRTAFGARIDNEAAKIITDICRRTTRRHPISSVP
jgi:hypothetical protein